MSIPYPPKPWENEETFQYTADDGRTYTVVYDAERNAWNFYLQGSFGSVVTTEDVKALKVRPSTLANPFNPDLAEISTQQDVNWYLYDQDQILVQNSPTAPVANEQNKFWFNETDQALYIWENDQWIPASPASDTLRGFVLDASGGDGNTSGNIVIKNDPNTPDSGRLYISDANGDSKFTIFSSGSVETKNSLSFAGTNTNKNIRAYGVANPNLRFMVGPNSDNLFELMTIDSNFVKVKENFRAEKTSSFSGTMTLSGELLAMDDITCSGSGLFSTDLTVTGNISSNGTLTVGGLTSITNDLDVGGNIELSESLKLYSSNPIEFNLPATQTITLAETTKVKVQPTIYGGGAQGNPTNGYFEIGVRDTSQAYVTFPYKIDLGTEYETNIEAPKIARMYLNNGGFYFYKGSGSSTPASNILTIFNRNGNAMEAWAPIRSSVYTGDTYGITISAEHNTTSLWNQPKAGQLAFQTWTDAANSNGGCTGVLVGPNHTKPSFVFTFEPKNVSQYQIFSNTYSPTYGKRMYVYPDYSNPNVPDETPVTIGYLKEHSIVGQATYTSSQGAPDSEIQDQNFIITQSSVSVPAQLEFEGRTDTGRGFTLLGKSVSQPTNSSSMLLSAYHTSQDGAAEIDYFGATSNDANIQTGESVNSRIQSATNALSVLPTTWDFYNSVSPGTASQLTGSWVLQWASNADSVIMIVSAVNDSNTAITTGTVISSIPSGIAPNKCVAIPLTSRNGMTTASAIVSPTTGFITVRNVQGPGDHRLEGQFIYSLHID